MTGLLDLPFGSYGYEVKQLSRFNRYIRDELKSCHFTSSASASRNVSMKMAGRTGFIEADMFVITQSGLSKTK